MKGKTVRIDKTARQKGAPSWLKELLYVDDAKNAAKTDRQLSEGPVFALLGGLVGHDGHDHLNMRVSSSGSSL